MVLRIGELLVAQGVLDETQVAQVLETQRNVPEPFGAICERLFGISPRTIEGVWSEQYARLSFDDGALMLATTKRHLARALRFATNVIRYPAIFVILDADDLAAELSSRYPIKGLDASFVDGDRLETTSWLRHDA
jgi:hypothetical protein